MVTLIWAVIAVSVAVGFYYDAKYKRELAELDQLERAFNCNDQAQAERSKVVLMEDYR